MKSMSNIDSPPYLLLVEGQDDQHFVQHLLSKEPELPFFSILNKDGIDNLIKGISSEVKVPGRKILGILVDGNSNPMERWRQIANEFKKLKIEPNEVPDRPKQEGLIINSTPKIGVWLMPDNKSPGEIENFAVQMVPENDPIWPFSKKYIEKIPDEKRLFSPDKIEKAQFFAWLATRKKSGRMGAAMGSDSFNLDNELTMTFLKWLSQLFQLDGPPQNG